MWAIVILFGSLTNFVQCRHWPTSFTFTVGRLAEQTRPCTEQTSNRHLNPQSESEHSTFRTTRPPHKRKQPLTSSRGTAHRSSARQCPPIHHARAVILAPNALHYTDQPTTWMAPADAPPRDPRVHLRPLSPRPADVRLPRHPCSRAALEPPTIPAHMPHSVL